MTVDNEQMMNSQALIQKIAKNKESLWVRKEEPITRESIAAFIAKAEVAESLDEALIACIESLHSRIAKSGGLKEANTPVRKDGVENETERTATKILDKDKFYMMIEKVRQLTLH